MTAALLLALLLALVLALRRPDYQAGRSERSVIEDPVIEDPVIEDPVIEDSVVLRRADLGNLSAGVQRQTGLPTSTTNGRTSLVAHPGDDLLALGREHVAPLAAGRDGNHGHHNNGESHAQKHYNYQGQHGVNGAP